MDKKKAINKFRLVKNQRQLIQLEDGVVVGTEADEENRLWYVVKRDGGLVVERAKGQKIRQVFDQRTSGKVTISLKKNKVI